MKAEKVRGIAELLVSVAAVYWIITGILMVLEWIYTQGIDATGWVITMMGGGMR